MRQDDRSGRVFHRDGDAAFEERAAVAQALPPPSAMRSAKRVLVVDDNQVIQDILKQFLGRGYAVEVVSNASLALASVVQKTPDAILLDVRMPGVDGLSLLKSLRDMGVSTPIFVMTGYDSTQVAVEAGARRLVITHISPRYTDTDLLKAQARAVFPGAQLARDGKVVTLARREANE